MSALYCVSSSPFNAIFYVALRLRQQLLCLSSGQSVSQSVSQDASNTVRSSARRSTLQSERLAVTSDDPRISKILETDRQTDRPVVIAIQNIEWKCVLNSNADVGYEDTILSAIEGMFSAKSCLPGHEGPEGQ